MPQRASGARTVVVRAVLVLVAALVGLLVLRTITADDPAVPPPAPGTPAPGTEGTGALPAGAARVGDLEVVQSLS